MRCFRSPAVQRGPRFGRARGRAEQHRGAFAALDQGHPRTAAKSIELLDHSSHRPVARAFAAPVDRRHRCGTIEQHDEVRADVRRRQAGARQDQREGERRDAFQNEARRDRQPVDPAAGFRSLPADLPEEQPGDGPDGKAPAKQMDGHDCRDGQQCQQTERRREGHAASSTPAAASPRATSRTGVPATTWAKRAPTRRAAPERPSRRRLNRAR